MPDFDDTMALAGRFMRAAEALDPMTLPADELARWVTTVRGAVKRLRDVDDETSKVLGAVLVPKTPTILDGLVVESNFTVSRTEWKNDRLRDEVLKAARHDPLTGERRDAEDALDVIGDLYPLGGAGLRLKAAAKLIPNWQTDEFCHEERKVTVKITEPGQPKKESD